MSIARSVPVRCLLCVGAALIALSSAAVAADRVVLFEDFTATWCGPCISVGQALKRLQTDFPESVAALQIHGDDPYEVAWGNARANSYQVTGYPTMICDGTLKRVGSSGNQNTEYAIQNGWRQSRLDVPTDVTIQMWANEVSGQTYEFRVEICREAGSGDPRTMAFYLVRALDNYPPGDKHVNCLMEGSTSEEFTLAPGECKAFTRTMTFDDVSWSRPGDIRIISWASAPGSSGLREVYNAKRELWPLPPFSEGTPGDLNCDGEANFGDINPFVLALSDQAAWQAQYPDCDIANGDVNGDGVFNFGDINAFVELLSGN